MIYSINVKHNIMFEVMKEHFALTSQQIFNEVNSYFKEFNTLLNIAEIDYSSLKKCLVPSSDKKEICLVFDTLLIEECYYGAKIINNLLPLFDKNKSYNVIFGDLLSDTKCKHTNKILDEMCRACNIERVDEHHFTNRYFLVYINNLCNTDFDKFANKLKSLPYFVGYADMTYSSIFKAHVSVSIGSGFVLLKNTVICPHEPDLEEVLNVNIYGFDFQNNEYNLISLSSDYYSVFLDYLIDPSLPNIPIDKSYKNLMADIIGHHCNLNEFCIDLPDGKVQYLISEKNIDNRLENPDDLKATIIQLVANSIKRNIFYELNFDKIEFGVIMFNVYIDINPHTKLTCGVKYNIESKNFEIITMF